MTESSERGLPREGERGPWPLVAAALLVPVLFAWTLPQSLSGLVVAAYRALQGHRPCLARFGPFLYVLVRAPGPWTRGISLGLVAFADDESIVKHELCHLLTGLWLGWTYLPVYGIEYLIFGHDRSPHERLTCRFERTLRWRYVTGR